MRTQQQAEKEEQQRIKNLVLNYDMRENEEQDGMNSSTEHLPQRTTADHGLDATAYDRLPSFHSNRIEKPSKDRGAQRARRLQLSDVDWYGNTHRSLTQPLERSVRLRMPH